MKTKILPSYILAETSYASGAPAVSPLKRLMGGLTALAVVVSLLLAGAVPVRAGARDAGFMGQQHGAAALRLSPLFSGSVSR